MTIITSTIDSLNFSSIILSKPLEIIPSASIIIGITVTFMFHSFFFSALWQVASICLYFRFLLFSFYGPLGVLYFLLINTRSGGQLLLFHFFQVFHTSSNRRPFTGVWVTLSLLRPPGNLWVFLSILTILWSGYSRYFWFQIPPFFSPRLWIPFQVHQLRLALPLLLFSKTFLVLWQGQSICLSFRFISSTFCYPLER